MRPYIASMNTANVSKTGMEFARSGSRRTDGRSEIILRKDQLHRWNGNRVGMIVEAREGTVWLTQANDRMDIILTSGNSFRINRPGAVVAQSLAPTARLVAK